MGVYERLGASGLFMEYAIANAGTEPSSASDWLNNAEQPFGNSPDMYISITTARAFVQEHPGANITFVEHSKGGAETTANAVATNKNAIVFNPATVNLRANRLSGSSYTGNVAAYVVQGGILQSTWDELGKPFGSVVDLPQQYANTRNYNETVGNMINNHLMPSVKNALKQWETGQWVKNWGKA